MKILMYSVEKKSTIYTEFLIAIGCCAIFLYEKRKYQTTTNSHTHTKKKVSLWVNLANIAIKIISFLLWQNHKSVILT